MKKSGAGLLFGSWLLLAGCGGGGPAVASAPASVLLEGSGPVPANAGGYVEFEIPRAGTLNATVDWTFATNRVIAAMTTDACNDLFAAFDGRCSDIGSPLLGTGKPKMATGTVSQAGRGRLWIGNLGNDESVAVQITLTGAGVGSTPTSQPGPRAFAGSWVRTK
jgi:hypothetical protein